MTASSLCRHGMWVTEEHAIELLSLDGVIALKDQLSANTLPHVYVEQGKKQNVPPPFNKQAFYFIGPAGTAVSRLSMSIQFPQWVELCVALDGADATTIAPKKLALFAKYAGTGINMKTVGAQVNELRLKKALVTPSDLGEADKSSLGNFFDKEPTKKVNRKSAGNTVMGDRIVSKVEEGEIYIRADGKKVRRVKKTIIRPKAANGSGESPSEDKSLSSFMGTSKPARGSAASVGGAPAKTAPESEVYRRADGKLVRRVKKVVPRTAVGDLSGGDEGEIIIKPDGTKVRRIKKTVSRAKSSESLESNGPSDGLSNFLGTTAGSKKKLSGSRSVSGVPSKASTEGGVYRNKDGKLVRRVKKSSLVASAASAQSSAGDLEGGLGGFLGMGAKKSKGMSGSASVGGERSALKSNASAESEIYIRADGKKVRRVKKSSLEGFIGSGTSKSKMSGSATVSGDNPSKEMGEIIIKPDGTKVRRIRKTIKRTGSSDLADSGNPGEKPNSKSGLTSFFGNNTAPSKNKMSGSKSVSPDMPEKNKSDSSKRGLSSFFGAAPKKKMSGSRSVSGMPTKKTASKASAEGEVYRNKDGKLVRRVKKSALGASTTTSAAGDLEGGLGGFLGKGAKKSNNMSGSASVGGARPALKPNASADSEIYIRADGKKVRRVKKSAVEPGTSKLGGFFDKNEGTKPRRSGSATVSGDHLSKNTDGGEIIIRDGKKILRRKKNPSEASKDGDVYRRADGKLVRRVKRASSSSNAAGDLVLSKAVSKASSGKQTDAPTPSPPDTPKAKNDGQSSVERPTTPQTAPLSESSGHQEEPNDPARTPISVMADFADSTKSSSAPTQGLSEDDEAVAAFYRKKLKFGMPLVAVKAKMEQDSIDAKIIAAVTDEEPASALAPEAPPAPMVSASTPAQGLSEDDEAVAAFYRKKLKFGMPLVAVKAKMEQDNVDAKIIAAVTDEEPASAPAPEAPPAPMVSASTPAQGLSEDDEAVAAFYRKKLKFGMPLVAVKAKMEQDNVDAKIIAAVTGEETPAAVPPAPASEASPATPSATGTVAASSLSQDDQAIADLYLRKKKMGMPEPAVRLKMEQDGVDQRIIAFVMGETPASSTAAVATPPSQQEPAVLPSSEAAILPGAYAIVIDGGGEEKSSKGLGAKLAIGAGSGPGDSDSQSVGTMATVSMHDKFAVNVDGESDANSGPTKTKFLTLDELAKMTGQSRDSLEGLVVSKRTNGEAAPKFTLQPLEKQEERFEVAIPTGSKPSGNAAPAPASAPAPAAVPGKNMTSLRDGQEVVDSGLASTARAVSALGDGDMQALLAKLQSGDVEGLLAKLQEAEKRQKKLEKQLAASGIAIAEDIDYSECKVKVTQIAKRMHEIGGSDVTSADKNEQNKLREEYFKLEQDMERFNTALMCTEEYQNEQARMEQKWEDDNWPDSVEALKKVRRHLPVMIRHMSEADLTNNPTPNGKFLPKAIAKKFKRTNVLQCLRLNPDDLERMHPSTLENMRVTGLTLTERRALYAHLKVLGPRWEKNKAEKMSERKWTWYQMMKNNFKENLAPYQRHVAQYGPPGSHPYATRDDPKAGCPMIGKQCPIKADQLPSYDTDYGYTDEAEYELSEVTKAEGDDPGARAMQEALELAKEKKSNERADLLKKHYKGKLLQVSKANGSCENMDDTMDKCEYHLLKWVEFMLEKGADESEDDKKKEMALFTDALNEIKLAILDFAQRSGMQMSGKRKAGGDAVDIRSSVECSLSEDMIECAKMMFDYITNRKKDLSMRDTRVEKTVELLENMLTELHEKNLATMEKLGVKRAARSRKLKLNEDLKKEVEEKMKPKEEEAAAEEPSGGGPPSGPPGGRGGGGGRGGLLGAISGRGGGGGRGGLLGAISGRGGRGGGGGRGGLLDAIGGRGRGGGGGRGGLMGAIQGRGAGGGGGRGGLLGAIQGRGGGGGGGGRGGLMAAIAAKGGG